MSRKPCNTYTTPKHSPSTPLRATAKPSTKQNRRAAILNNVGEPLDEMLARHASWIAKFNYGIKDAAWRRSVECLTRDDLEYKPYIDIKHEMGLDHLEATKAYHPELRGAWRRHTVSAVTELVGERLDHGQIYVWLLTIINKAWRTKPESFEFDLTRTKTWFRNALGVNAGHGSNCKEPVNFVAVFEFEMMNVNREGRGRKRYDQVHPHVHALVWSADREGTEAKFKALKRSRRIELRSPGAKDVYWKRLRSCADVIRVASYLLKSPSGAKRRLKKKESGWFSLVNDTLTRVGRSQLTLLLSDFKLSELVCASGEGVLVRRRAVAALAAERAAARRAEAKRRKPAGVKRSKKSKRGVVRRKKWKARPRKP